MFSKLGIPHDAGDVVMRAVFPQDEKKEGDGKMAKMKIEIYEEQEKKDEANTMRLRLEAIDDEYIVLMVVDENGDRMSLGNILRISPNGIFRYKHCHCGLPTGHRGRVVLDE